MRFPSFIELQSTHVGGVKNLPPYVWQVYNLAQFTAMISNKSTFLQARKQVNSECLFLFCQNNNNNNKIWPICSGLSPKLDSSKKHPFLLLGPWFFNTKATNMLSFSKNSQLLQISADENLLHKECSLILIYNRKVLPKLLDASLNPVQFVS